MAKSPEKSKVKGKKKKKPRFCPNSSRNSNLNSSRTSSRRFEGEEELKKNNAELAKALNMHKEALARLCGEKQEQEAQIMELKVEISQLKGRKEPEEVELEVQRRVREELGRMEKDLRTAVDHTLGLSSILGRLVTSTSQSLVPAAAKRGSDVGGTKMRQVVTGVPGTWTRGGGEASSQVRQLSKVSPMVAGHAITRPRIQLARMDLSSVQLPAEVGQEEGEEGIETPTEGNSPTVNVDQLETATPDISPTVDNTEDEDNDEVEPTPPPPPGRNPFDLTNIREESTFLEDSILNTMEETLVTPNMEVLAEEEEEERPALLTSTTLRQSTRLSLKPQVAEVISRSPNPSTFPLDIPGTSPYVLDQSPGNSQSQMSPAVADHSSLLTESFFEQLGDIDPREGPSWLFASVKKKKKRRNASKKLSAIFSDLDVSNNSADTSANFMLADNLESPPVSAREENQENQEREETQPVSVREPSLARTPLSPLTQHRDDSGHLVNIMEPRIMLSNVGTQGEAEDTQSPAVKGKRTLDELFSLVRSSPRARHGKRKCTSEQHSEQPSKQPQTKKTRCTDLPDLTKLQDLEVRLEKVEVPVSESSAAESSQGEGRTRRNRSQVSYKEPSLGKKLRQGDQVSNISYDDNFKPELKKKTKKPKIKNPK